MEQLFTELVSFLPSIVFAVLVYAGVLGQRKIVEHFWKKAKDHWWWREVLLPAGPYGTALILALIVPSWPFPAIFMTSWILHACFGVFLGAISGQVYRTFWSFLKKKKDEIDGDNDGK